MHISILIPHYRTGKMTAYAISQLLKYKGDHELDIFVVDNSPLDGSLEYLDPFIENIYIFEYPQAKLQSHGIAYDFILPYVKTDFFITMESDSFPTSEKYFDYIEDLINKGYDAGGSRLKLSGGEYMHGAGAFYKTSVWKEAKEYCDKIPYQYFPNMAMKEGFACHLMVHNDLVDYFLMAPEDYIELANGYKPYSEGLAAKKLTYYEPIRGVFHNGMGNREESVYTYGQRTIESEAPTVFFDGKKKLIKRIGAEPSQFFSWYLCAMNKKLAYIPTEVKWIDGKEGHQQEYTLMENGFKHLWGVSAYHGTNLNDSDVAKVKQSLPEQLYETLPEHQKIKSI